MLLDIRHFEDETLIIFKKKDLVDRGELIRTCSAMANRFCFEAGSLLSLEFDSFLNILKTRNKYCVIVGIDQQNKPSVQWGVFKE